MLKDFRIELFIFPMDNPCLLIRAISGLIAGGLIDIIIIIIIIIIISGLYNIIISGLIYNYIYIYIHIYIIFLDSTKLKIVWIKITTFFRRRVSIIL